jgi:hypothetical protein
LGVSHAPIQHTGIPGKTLARRKVGDLYKSVSDIRMYKCCVPSLPVEEGPPGRRC